jgi:hypothetical protein
MMNKPPPFETRPFESAPSSPYESILKRLLEPLRREIEKDSLAMKSDATKIDDNIGE